MILIDINLLIYAYHAETPHHSAALAWFGTVLGRGELLGVPIPVAWGFLRVSTTARMWPNPAAPDQAFAMLNEFLAIDTVVLIDHGPRHLQILEDLLTRYNIAGPKVSDAVLAAFAIEHNATLASTDRDFARFESLRWVNPIA